MPKTANLSHSSSLVSCFDCESKSLIYPISIRFVHQNKKEITCHLKHSREMLEPSNANSKINKDIWTKSKSNSATWSHFTKDEPKIKWRKRSKSELREREETNRRSALYTFNACIEFQFKLFPLRLFPLAVFFNVHDYQQSGSKENGIPRLGKQVDSVAGSYFCTWMFSKMW